MARARPSAKTGPVNRDRLVIRAKPLLKWSHFTPRRNRAQRGQQQNQRPLPAPISPKFDRRALVMPRQLLGLHVLAGSVARKLRQRLSHVTKRWRLVLIGNRARTLTWSVNLRPVSIIVVSLALN